MALVAPEAPSEQAKRVFQTYDPEGKKFYCFINSMVYIFINMKYIDTYLSFIKSYWIIE